ncbi:MAG: hypothetical protein QF535_15080, partial [Anaerolineales bacterium]|nr:hypothetical protein [Anaerolineales bacterium]
MKDKKLHKTNTYICKINDTKNEINIACSNSKRKREGFKLGAFYYYEGQPLVCRVNLRKYKKEGIYNAQQVTLNDWEAASIFVVKQNGDEIALKDVKLKQIEGEKEKYDFEPAHCITTQRIQGGKIDHKYNIVDVNLKTKNEMYVDLSRATKYDDIGFEYTDREFTTPTTNISPFTIKPKIHGQDTDYQKGIIYGCYHNGRLVYIGSTTNIKTRTDKHFIDASNGDTSNFHIFLADAPREDIEFRKIKDAPSSSWGELEYKEGKTIDYFINKGYDLFNQRKYGVKVDRISHRQKVEDTHKNEKYPIINDKKAQRLYIKHKGKVHSIRYARCGYE